jgi:hypothetical protein
MPSGFSKAGLPILPFCSATRSYVHFWRGSHTTLAGCTSTQRMQRVSLPGHHELGRRAAQNIRRKAIMQRTIGYLRPPSPAFVSHKRRVVPFDVLQLQLLPLTFYPLSLSSAPFSTILLTIVARNTLLALVAASAGALVSAQGSGDGVQSSSLFLPCVADGAPQGRTTTPDSARAGSQTQTPT